MWPGLPVQSLGLISNEIRWMSVPAKYKGWLGCFDTSTDCCLPRLLYFIILFSPSLYHIPWIMFLISCCSRDILSLLVSRLFCRCSLFFTGIYNITMKITWYSTRQIQNSWTKERWKEKSIHMDVFTQTSCHLHKYKYIYGPHTPCTWWLLWNLVYSCFPCVWIEAQF